NLLVAKLTILNYTTGNNTLSSLNIIKKENFNSLTKSSQNDA
ncbi:21691_t:CDS:1, partial [Rhizophagus irregularis]